MIEDDIFLKDIQAQFHRLRNIIQSEFIASDQVEFKLFLLIYKLLFIKDFSEKGGAWR